MNLQTLHGAPSPDQLQQWFFILDHCMIMIVLQKRSWYMWSFETWWKEDSSFRNWEVYVSSNEGRIFYFLISDEWMSWALEWGKSVETFGLLFIKVLGFGFSYCLVSKVGSAVLVLSMCWFSSAYTDTCGKITIPVSLALQLLWILRQPCLCGHTLRQLPDV